MRRVTLFALNSLPGDHRCLAISYGVDPQRSAAGAVFGFISLLQRGESKTSWGQRGGGLIANWRAAKPRGNHHACIQKLRRWKDRLVVVSLILDINANLPAAADILSSSSGKGPFPRAVRCRLCATPVCCSLVGYNRMNIALDWRCVSQRLLAADHSGHRPDIAPEVMQAAAR